MRIPKRVNDFLDRMERHKVALGVVTALVLITLPAAFAPPLVGLPIAAFVLGLAAGGFHVHLRLSRRLRRARADVDNLLRENGALRHRNNILASGVISREATETQALVSIPDDDLLDDDLLTDDSGSASGTTVTLDELLDGDPRVTVELPGSRGREERAHRP